MLESIGIWIAPNAPALLSSLAAMAVAVVAIVGYRKWHKETVGKRKVELAEDILADVYRAQDVFTWARFPGGYRAESETRPKSDSEDEQDSSIKDDYFRTVVRLEEEGHLFSRIQSKKYQSMASFGKETKALFDELKMVHSRIVSAAAMLMKYHSTGKASQIEKWEAIIGWSPEPDANDEIAAEIDSIVNRFEETFGQWLLRK